MLRPRGTGRGGSSEAESSTPSEELPAEDDAPTEADVRPRRKKPPRLNSHNLLVAGNEISSATPYAIVVVNPDSALHIRQFPSSDALSLGLLPAASDVLVLGRRAPADIGGDALSLLPVDLSDYTEDPAAALLPYQDLSAAETWLFVVYVTPDGGALYGWVNAFYLQVFSQNGERQRLASLTPVPQNQLGGATNTEMRPPLLSDHVSARVYGLDADAFLNLAHWRRRQHRSSHTSRGRHRAGTSSDWMPRKNGHSYAMNRRRGTSQPAGPAAEFIELLLNGKPALAASLRALDPSAVRVIGAEVTGVIQPADPADRRLRPDDVRHRRRSQRQR